MAPLTTQKPGDSPIPNVLIVEDEPAVVELIHDVVGASAKARLLAARDMAEARRLLEHERIDLMLLDINLPDGDGLSLLPTLRQSCPQAQTLVMTGQPTVSGTIAALRAGVLDFVPKPFTIDVLRDRIAKALRRQALAARQAQRLSRLKVTVKRLNVLRHTVSKKVDLLCNDLVSAYGEVSRQVDTIRIEESFRKVLVSAADLEQMLCHAMDFILRRIGYCNVAIWLAGDDEGYELGAYMKYTIPGDAPLTSALRRGALPLVQRQGFARLTADDIQQKLTPDEGRLLRGQVLMGADCTYLGESLGSWVLFRDQSTPFSDDDAALLQAISPVFAVCLAGMVRNADDEEGGDGGTMLDDGDHPRPSTDADWWKRGDAPPF
jgi:DNA-binding NarL/FixJ family response regulator